MSRKMIYLDDAINAVKAGAFSAATLFGRTDEGMTALAETVRLIKDLPAAESEIIRCQDCKHWDKTWTNDWSPDYHYCPMIDGVRKGDFYCADAERRTDE